MKHKRTVKEAIAMIVRGYRIVFQILPQYMTWRIINSIADLLSPYFALYMSSLVVNELADSHDLNRLLRLAAIAVGGLFLISIASRLVHGRVKVYESQMWRADHFYNLQVQNKLQYAHLENPDVALLRQRIYTARMSNGSGLPRLIWNVGTVTTGIGNVIFSVSLTVSMFAMTAQGDFSGFLGFVNSPFGVVLLLGLILCNAAVSILTTNAETKKVMEEFKDLAYWNRHYFALSSLREHDTHIFGINRLIEREEAKSIDPPYLRNAQKHKRNYGAIRTVWDHVMTFVLFVYVAAKAYIGAFGIGSFVLYRGTVAKFISGLSDIALAVGNLLQNNDALAEQFAFVDLPNDTYHGTLSVEKRDDIDYEIEFRDVSFKYPRSDAWALRHVSLKFKIGDRIAVVGMNGSGKTTFIKLLCRLYDPTEGKILLNGIDITRYKYEEYMKLFSVVFQDYKLFSFSIAHNVAAELNYDADKVRSCLDRAGFGKRLRELERDIETPLHRDYEDDGIDVSGGEAQKIAIARALYKDAPFIILDEPTAALDPIAEAEIYNQFNEIVDNKTAVYISHRLSSCRFCSNIVVFDHGEIVQQGSHDALVADENGKYHELWHAQAQYYV